MGRDTEGKVVLLIYVIQSVMGRGLSRFTYHSEVATANNDEPRVDVLVLYKP